MRVEPDALAFLLGTVCLVGAATWWSWTAGVAALGLCLMAISLVIERGE